jgi:TolA-binding protein
MKGPGAVGAARPVARGLALALGAFALSHCVVMQSDFERLERRVTTVERNDSERRQQLQNAILQATGQVQTLNQQLEQARAQTRDLANLTARFDGIDEQMRSLNGGLEEIRHTIESSTTEQNALRTTLSTQLSALEHRITEVERRVGLAPAVDPNQIPADNGQLMAQARQALAARDFNRTRALVAALLQRAPSDALAPEARLLNARTYFQEGRNATAAQEYQRILTDAPNSPVAPDAMAEMAEAFVNLGLCTPAQRTLRLLTERFASTPQARAARTRLQQVQHLPRAACQSP